LLAATLAVADRVYMRALAALPGGE
jgi:hypothetical protein